MYDRPESGYGVFYGDGDERNVAVPLSSVDDILRTKEQNCTHWTMLSPILPIS